MLKAEETALLAAKMKAEIRRLCAGRKLRVMEVCGTHTVAIFRHGLRELLADEIELISGPGCPVCVTPRSYLDTALACAAKDNVSVLSYGDLLRVPASNGSLAFARAQGADVRVVTSPLEAFSFAVKEPQRRFVFLAVGFETTAPAASATLQMARTAGLRNLFFLSAHKLVPPVLEALLEEDGCKLDGLLLPGHVSAVIGLSGYRFIAAEKRMPCVVAGFAALEILQAVLALAEQCAQGAARLENHYRHVVTQAGNVRALEIMSEFYQAVDAEWRGFGRIKSSGLELRPQYRQWDAVQVFGLPEIASLEPPGCRCAEVLQGKIRPPECELFGGECTPLHPVGACMVSLEGACAAWHNHGGGKRDER